MLYWVINLARRFPVATRSVVHVGCPRCCPRLSTVVVHGCPDGFTTLPPPLKGGWTGWPTQAENDLVSVPHGFTKASNLTLRHHDRGGLSNEARKRQQTTTPHRGETPQVAIRIGGLLVDLATVNAWQCGETPPTPWQPPLRRARQPRNLSQRSLHDSLVNRAISATVIKSPTNPVTPQSAAAALRARRSRNRQRLAMRRGQPARQRLQYLRRKSRVTCR